MFQAYFGLLKFKLLWFSWFSFKIWKTLLFKFITYINALHTNKKVFIKHVYQRICRRYCIGFLLVVQIHLTGLNYHYFYFYKLLLLKAYGRKISNVSSQTQLKMFQSVFLHWHKLVNFERRQKTIDIYFQVQPNSSEESNIKLLLDGIKVAWETQSCFKIIGKFLLCLKDALFLVKISFFR